MMKILMSFVLLLVTCLCISCGAVSNWLAKPENADKAKATSQVVGDWIPAWNDILKVVGGAVGGVGLTIGGQKAAKKLAPKGV